MINSVSTIMAVCDEVRFEFHRGGSGSPIRLVVNMDRTGVEINVFDSDGTSPNQVWILHSDLFMLARASRQIKNACKCEEDHA